METDVERGKMLMELYHYDPQTMKLVGKDLEVDFDPLEYSMNNKFVPLVPANATTIAPGPGLGRTGDLYFDKERQAWYVVEWPVNEIVKQPEELTPELQEKQTYEVRAEAKKEIESLVELRMKAFDVDGSKSHYRMYLETYARQYLRDWKAGTPTDPGWIALLAAAEKMSVHDYCDRVLKFAYRGNSIMFKLKAIKAKYLRLINAAPAGPRIDYLLTEARKEISTFQPYDEVKLEDI